VALHEGDQDIYKRAVANRVRTLRDNLPADDPAVRAAAPALGDMWIKLGQYKRADSSYRAAERNAVDAGQDTAALMVAVRRVWLLSATGQKAQARRMLDAIEARPAAKDPRVRIALRIMRFRIAARDADDAEMTTLAGLIGRSQAARPALIWSPPFEPDRLAAANASARKVGQADTFQARSTDASGVEWMDVGFWIRPDGRTAEVEILRSSKSPSWADAVLAQIEGRRYAAAANPPADAAMPDAESVYHIERITKGSNYVTPVGSLIRRRVSADGFETLDLTDVKDSRG
jgi:ATP/maltotriose-dependent transcriptional regulator MalT